MLPHGLHSWLIFSPILRLTPPPPQPRDSIATSRTPLCSALVPATCTCRPGLCPDYTLPLLVGTEKTPFQLRSPFGWGKWQMPLHKEHRLWWEAAVCNVTCLHSVELPNQRHPQWIVAPRIRLTRSQVLVRFWKSRTSAWRARGNIVDLRCNFRGCLRLFCFPMKRRFLEAECQPLHTGIRSASRFQLRTNCRVLISWGRGHGRQWRGLNEGFTCSEKRR